MLLLILPLIPSILKNSAKTQVFLSLLLLTSHFSYAQQSQSLGAHVHGLAEITVAIDSNHLEIEFISPAINLVGFEYKAKTTDDIALVNQAQSILQNADALFSIERAQCELIKHVIDLSSIKKSDEHQHHESSFKAHQHHHEKNTRNNHTDHTEVIAHYLYHCEKHSLLSGITVNVFNYFTGVKQVNALWVNNLRQGASKLNANKNVLTLR